MNILFISLLFSSLALAQDRSDLLDYQGRALGSKPLEQIAETKKILSAVQKITDAQGVQTEIRNLKDKAGNTYPVMVVIPGRSSLLNTEAQQVAQQLGGLPLVFSPYDLGRSRSSAFFDPDGSKLGVSYRFVLGDAADPSYVHELYHASTYAKVLGAKKAQWAGVMRLLKGEALSQNNRSYYNRFASLDEMVATALSLKLETERILTLKKEMTPQEFNRDREEAYGLLNSIYSSAQMGIQLARQSLDLAQRALNAQPQTTTTVVTLGKVSKSLPTSLYSLDSYSWEFVAGKSSVIPQKSGAEYKLYWSKAPTAAMVSSRLKNIIQQSQVALKSFIEAEKCLYVLVEYPDLAKSDYRCLESRAPLAYDSLNAE